MESTVKRLEKRLGQMKVHRGTYEAHWKELADYFSPRQARHISQNNVEHQPKGDKRNYKIINSTPLYAVRTLQAGMMSGNTSPARQWFRLTTPDPQLAEDGPVAEWLHIAQTRMSNLFLTTNLYRVLPMVYKDLGIWGPSCVIGCDDEENLMHFKHWEIGSYWLADSSRSRVDTAFREFGMTVRQVVQEFGYANCSSRIQNMFTNGQYETWETVSHAIEPDGDKWKSVYWERGHNEKPLAERFLNGNRILAPRWDVYGQDVYGTSPGMDCLGDSKALQIKERKKAKAIDIMIDPPLQAPSSLQGKSVSLIPGEITYVDITQAGDGIRSIHQWRPEIQYLNEDIGRTEELIRTGFFVDLFLMLANDTRSNITAREIIERHEEKLLMLGPVIERLNNELLSPLIDMTFERMVERSMPIWSGVLDGDPILPPPPEELAGIKLKVEFVSVMAQAQKAVGAGAMDNLVMFTTSLAALKPDVLDKLDFDQMIDERADMLGVSPKIIVSDDDVSAIRAQRQQAMAAQQAAMAAQTAGQTAKDLSQADMSGDNALTRAVEMVSG